MARSGHTKRLAHSGEAVPFRFRYRVPVNRPLTQENPMTSTTRGTYFRYALIATGAIFLVGIGALAALTPRAATLTSVANAGARRAA